MPTPFLSSVPGRILMTAAGVYLLSAAAYLLWGNLTAFGIGLPAAITLSFVGVGLGMSDYTRQTLWAVIGLPPALWGFIYLIGEFNYRAGHSWGYGIGLLGVMALGKAAMGGGQSQPAKA